MSEGTNRLIKPDDMLPAIREVLAGRWPKGRKPLHWDGQTAGRCVTSLKRWLDGSGAGK